MQETSTGRQEQVRLGEKDDRLRIVQAIEVWPYGQISLRFWDEKKNNPVKKIDKLFLLLFFFLVCLFKQTKKNNNKKKSNKKKTQTNKQTKKNQIEF